MTGDQADAVAMLSDRDSEVAALTLAVGAHGRLVDYADSLPWWRWLAARHAEQATAITGRYACELALMLGVELEVSHG